MDYYKEKIDYMDTNYKRIEPMDFYREIFPKGSFEEKGKMDSVRKGNGIIVYKTPKGDTHTNIVFDDLQEIKECLNETRDCYTNAPFASLSLCSYVGRTRTNKNAFDCFGITIDVDDVKENNLITLMHQASINIFPCPTYVVVSGNGVHVYYIFDTPIHITPENFQCLNDIKDILSAKVWNGYTSQREDPEFQGITQAYRMPGSKTKKGHRVVAYVTGTKINIETIIDNIQAMTIIENHYGLSKTYKFEKRYQETRKKMNKMLQDKRVGFDMIAKLCYNTDHIPLEQAKQKWPDWYERRVVNKLPAQHWTSNIALYNWWFKEISKKAVYKGRYYAIYGLTAFAQRCNVPYEKLKEDAYSLLEHFDSLSPSKDKDVRFTASDIEAAIGLYYTADLTRTSKKWLEKKVKFQLPDSHKRNGHDRNTHLAICRAMADTYRKLGQAEDWDKGGRPTKENIINTFLKTHPEETSITQIAQKCGVSRPTVYKYFKNLKKE